jgi:hypothetical protein
VKSGSLSPWGSISPAVIAAVSTENCAASGPRKSAIARGPSSAAIPGSSSWPSGVNIAVVESTGPGFRNRVYRAIAASIARRLVGSFGGAAVSPRGG